jgi:hypothetical protein
MEFKPHFPLNILAGFEKREYALPSGTTDYHRQVLSFLYVLSFHRKQDTKT